MDELLQEKYRIETNNINCVPSVWKSGRDNYDNVAAWCNIADTCYFARQLCTYQWLLLILKTENQIILQSASSKNTKAGYLTIFSFISLRTI